jgi:hypothetical protein
MCGAHFSRALLRPWGLCLVSIGLGNAVSANRVW